MGSELYPCARCNGSMRFVATPTKTIEQQKAERAESPHGMVCDHCLKALLAEEERLKAETPHRRRV